MVRYPFQVLVSYFLYKKVPGSKFYRIAFFIPSLIFSVATALIFRYMIAPEGFIAQWAGKLAGVDYVPELLADSKFANYTIWGQMLWLGFAGDLVIWGGTFARIPEDVLESAKMDGVTWWQEFTRIIVPQLRSSVVTKFTLLFLTMWNEYGSFKIFCLGRARQPITLMIASFFNTKYAVHWGQIGAAILLSSLPAIVIYCICNKQLENALTVGSLTK